MYIGHTDDAGRRQPLIEHLNQVSALAKEFASSFGMDDVGSLIGLLHDVGKYSHAAQLRMRGEGPRVDHSTAGGKLLLEHYGENLLTLLCCYDIMGHHTGLMDGGNASNPQGKTMYARLEKVDLPDYTDYQKELTLPIVNWPEFSPLEEIGYGFSLSFLGRMLYSCLVDADYLDTEAFMLGETPRGHHDSIATLVEAYNSYIARFSTPDTPIKQKRNEILQQCLAAAQRAKGIYTLTVPTGGGKTISSLGFALAHALKHNMRRVIFVIPYTSIIEQNAKVFADILGRENVLEHHSNVSYDETEDETLAKHLAMENWDSPVVITTNSQFFESLFSSKSSKCRKLHNIANSVIIFDEAQMLPLSYLRSCTKAIGELAQNYGCTAILCTATQSSLGSFFPQQTQRGEICEDPAQLYHFFRRTTIVDSGELSDDELVGKLNASDQALCIVNTKRHAQALYAALDGDGNFHLSTAMYPAHRMEVLNTIRTRLCQGQTCRVVSTSLVEAGVDLDFPTVYRARAGLDSVIQAAGRCNREGRYAAENAHVYVFTPAGEQSLPPSIKQTSSAFDMVARAHSDISSLEAIRAYFEQLRYIIGHQGLDRKNILEQLEADWREANFPYETLAREFRLIEEEAYDVFIPRQKECEPLLRQLREGQRSKALFRAVGMYSVSVRKHPLEKLLSKGMVEWLDENDERPNKSVREGIFVLTDPNAYDDNIGLKLEAEAGYGLFI